MTHAGAPATRIAAVTERGPRPVNQDAILSTTLPDGSDLIAVADGMGGQAAGEVASRMALGVLEAALRNGESLEAAVRAANAAVYEEARTHPEYSGMGTTIVAVHRTRDRYLIANVGDSRAYRIDDGGIRQLTLDHSFMAEAERNGALAADDVSRSPWRNAVTRAIGTAPEVQVDCFGPLGLDHPHAVLLCTDGLYRVLSDDELREAVRGAEPVRAARQLADAAEAAGSSDNISLAIIAFDASSVRAPLPPASRSPVPAGRGSQTARSWHDWKSTADAIIFSVLLILVIYLAVAALTRR